jgi:GntR family transcriptional regulator
MRQLERPDYGTPSTMNIQLDFRSRQPIYLQIVEQVRKLVASGELKQGDQLPTVRQLATELRVNFNTVARAYRLLDEAGLISTQQGRGTYIWEAPSAETVCYMRQQSLEGLTRDYLAEAARLSYTPDEIARTIVRYLQEWKEHDEAPTRHTEEHR